jgi:hypothetical protein
MATTGSLFNHLMENSSSPNPQIGMGATMLFWTDRWAGTITKVKGNTLIWQRDTANRRLHEDESTFNDSQSYDYLPNPNSPEYVFTLRKNGRWVKKGETMYGGTKLSIGHRTEYYDFSF